MAVSNSIGSNVFDILIGLGLPWALQTLAVDYGSYVSGFSAFCDLGHCNCVSGQRRCGNTHVEGKTNSPGQVLARSGSCGNIQDLRAELVGGFWGGPDSRYFRLCHLGGLCHSCHQLCCGGLRQPRMMASG